MMSKSWIEDNYFTRFHEADESYLDDLKRLINGEAVAAIQYQFAANSIVGPNQSYLVSHFTEHTSEEWGHYASLVEALMERDEEANASIANLISEALPATEELKSYDSEYLREFFIKAEDNAVEAYTEFYNRIERKDPDLADIIIGIIQDERAHSLDFSRIAKEEKETKEQDDEELDDDELDEEEEDIEEESEDEEDDDESKDKSSYFPTPDKF